MKNAFILALLVGIFAISAPLIADPGGGAVSSSVVSDQFVSSSVAVVETQTIVPASAEPSKSMVYAIVGGVAAVVGLITVAIMVDPFTRLRYRRRSEVSRLRKQTKSPLLKRTAAA